jgi:carboxypeptidase Taq
MSSPSLDPRLSERLGELADLGHVGHVLGWDQQVMMPPAGGPARAEALATISRLHHERLVAPALGELLDAAAASEPQIARAVRRDRDVARRVPSDLTAEMSRAGSDGYAAWLQAREDNDFATFEPALRRNIELVRRYADCFPEADHPYDPLLDRYEPGTTAARVTGLFARLREGLVPLLSQIAMQPTRQTFTGDFPIAGQREIGLEIVRTMGF